MARRGISRRIFLASTAATGAVVGGSWLATRKYLESAGKVPNLIPGEPLALTADGKLLDTAFPDPFAGGEYLGYLSFLYEAEQLHDLKPGVRLGKGHNARRIIDPASLLTPQGEIRPPTNSIFGRNIPMSSTPPPDWTIKIHGEVKQSKDVSLKELLPALRSKMPVLIECTDNAA